MRDVEIKKKYRCRYCNELVGCNEQGLIGMYSLKILRMHEKECPNNTPLEFNERWYNELLLVISVMQLNDLMNCLLVALERSNKSHVAIAFVAPIAVIARKVRQKQEGMLRKSGARDS
ncbi:hypothetical protein [Prochlorococcus marinus]|uniref:Uncharacterized protein n=1 Tax=Prochlorococcus marinus (strain MIT 9303) TaxID=59922 RepID=A2CCC7_PROM3|nr:hypothetical protein [Prochlorococcus marinus]ABM79137.1 Hypothetical protein P9303_24041 [Prochlorococcus marinus str. MIT 9303]